MRFNILVKHIFQNSHFTAIRNLDFTFSDTLAVQQCYSDFLLAEKQIERLT